MMEGVFRLFRVRRAAGCVRIYNACMKQVLILRHADWDLKDDAVTSEAKTRTLALKSKLPPLAKVISSSWGRSKQTAEFLGGHEPEVDDRVSFPIITAEISSQIALARRTHVLGVAGAIFAIPGAREPYRKQAEQFLQLIREIMHGLKDGETALIISHDGIMLALEKVLDNASFDSTDHTFGELQGYFLDDQLNQTPFKAA
jgi:broad specificity phosphatase PhoE